MILDQIAEGVLAYDSVKVIDNVNLALASNIEPKDIIIKGLAQGMLYVGQRYEQKKIFVPDMLRASKAFNEGLKILLPFIQSENENYLGKIVIGVVKGNTQDNGKNIVKIFLTAFGWQVIDLGKNVDPKQFVEKANEHGAEFICMSIMTNSGVGAAKEVIDLLVSEGTRKKYKVLIGGAAASEAIKVEIGADGYSKDAMAAQKLLESLKNSI